MLLFILLSSSNLILIKYNEISFKEKEGNILLLFYYHHLRKTLL